MRHNAITCVLIGVLVAATSAVAQAEAIWTAFNDFAGALSTGNVSNISLKNSGTGGRTGATAPSGPLVKFADGSATGVTLGITGDISHWFNNYTGIPPTGGDALAYFGGYTGLNMNDATAENAIGQTATMTLSGLDPLGLYSLTFFNNRGNVSGQSRLQNFQLKGADSFVNNSSAGSTIDTIAMTNDHTVFEAWNNSGAGRVARYESIAPGADGTIVVDVWATTATTNAYTYLVAMRLDLDSQVPEPSTFALLSAGLFGLLAYAWRKR